MTKKDLLRIARRLKFDNPHCDVAIVEDEIVLSFRMAPHSETEVIIDTKNETH